MIKAIGTALACFLFAGAAGAAERVHCPVIADNWVETTPWRSPGRESINHGADLRLRISGRESFTLFAFDMEPAKGIHIEKAVLRVRRDPDPIPLTAVGISTVSGSAMWSESEMHYLRAGKDLLWSYPGSDLAEVTFGLGGSLYAYARARDAGSGWYEIDIPPAIVASLATGDQFGLMLTDEKGQTRTHHAINSRESADPPVLIVEGERAIMTAGHVRAFSPQSAEALGRTSQRPGSVILRFGGAQAAHYDLRYSEAPIRSENFVSATSVPRWMLDPLAPKPNLFANSNSLQDEVNAIVENLKPGAAYYFAARGISATGQAGPVSSLGKVQAYSRHWPSLPAAPSSGAAKEGPAADSGVKVWSFRELHKVNPQTGTLLEGGPVWHEGVRLSGARNEFVAFQVAVESDTPVKDIAVTVDRPLFAECKLPPIFQETGAIQLYREWMVPDEKDTSPTRAWYPDALIPLSGTFDLPSADNAVPRQRVQPVFVDIYIPHDAVPGVHRGTVAVHAGGTLLRRIPVEVNVFPFALPDELSFLVDLNAYSGVNEGYDIQRGTPEYRALLHAYHRVAHLNRANLDILGYSHTGTTEPDQTPPLTGDGADTKVASWKDWDAHFGPLVSGSAFADLPRASVPVQTIYLALFENWPGDLRKKYKWNIPEVPRTKDEYEQLITRHGLESGPIEEGFPRDYQDRFSAVARQFAEHFRERRWTKTRYQIFFNDKYYYKDPTRFAAGKGVSWWLLDEPNHHDDYRALGFFGWLGKRWLKDYPDVPMVFRADISYVDFIRDQLPGLIDINCVSRHFFTKNRYLLDNRNRFGRAFWHYADTNHPRESNVSMRAWAWRAWTSGADGIVPWLTVRGGLKAWEQAEPLTVFYAGTKFEQNTPYASVRLKGFRRGQQDMEYLVLLAKKKGWDRGAVSRAVNEALDLTEKAGAKDEEDAGSVRFEKVSDEQLDQLRLRVAAALVD
ncbi:MAG: DUF4091 domain-containing protein [Bryobacterales bacterium]|nr:DUF4091 domain-containing protein [Bryobacterales bacterium]